MVFVLFIACLGEAASWPLSGPTDMDWLTNANKLWGPNVTIIIDNKIVWIQPFIALLGWPKNLNGFYLLIQFAVDIVNTKFNIFMVTNKRIL